jgi:hypothetical protein
MHRQMKIELQEKVFFAFDLVDPTQRIDFMIRLSSI